MKKKSFSGHDRKIEFEFQELSGWPVSTLTVKCIVQCMLLHVMDQKGNGKLMPDVLFGNVPDAY